MIMSVADSKIIVLADSKILRDYSLSDYRDRQPRCRGVTPSRRRG